MWPILRNVDDMIHTTVIHFPRKYPHKRVSHQSSPNKYSEGKNSNDEITSSSHADWFYCQKDGYSERK